MFEMFISKLNILLKDFKSLKTNQALISCIWTWHRIVARRVPARKATRYYYFFNVNILKIQSNHKRFKFIIRNREEEKQLDKKRRTCLDVVI